MGLTSCGSMGSLIFLNSLWLIAVDPHRGGSISLRPVRASTISRTMLRPGSMALRGVDGNRPRLGLSRLGQRQRQHAMLQVRANPFLVNPLTQLELPEEAHQRIFTVARVARRLMLGLAAQRQDVMIHTHVQMRRVDPRHVCHHHQALRRFVNIDRRRERVFPWARRFDAWVLSLGHRLGLFRLWHSYSRFGHDVAPRETISRPSLAIILGLYHQTAFRASYAPRLTVICVGLAFSAFGRVTVNRPCL